MAEALVSIIVPIYNVEAHLSKCLESIRCQTYKNIEVLMIDDGSPDKSWVIAKKYENEDVRFHYIKKENGGLSSARNLGLEYAMGDFISFIDSDDFIAIDYVAVLLSSFDDVVDVVIGEYAIFNFKKNKYYYHKGSMFENRVFSTEKDIILNDLLRNKSPYMPVWKNMYRMNLLKINNIKFTSERLIYTEDQVFNLAVYTKAHAIKTISDVIFFHLIVEGSLSQGYRKNMFDMVKERYTHIYNLLVSNNKDALAQKYLDSYPNIIIDTAVMLCRCELTEAIKNIKKLRNDQTYEDVFMQNKAVVSGVPYKIIAFFIQIKAFFCTALIIKIMMRIKRIMRTFEDKVEYNL